ncbi:MAG: glucose-1-phosphate adenylyltransferase subunit GlgD [Eubacterium sp.]|nr:glucose-1-phosphate adenylyltransferase subunit GlgD [Eubacterium sp.]
MKLAGIIFSDTYDVALDELLMNRTIAAIPFGGRYRLIDFSLSNMVNSGVQNVGIVVKKNYQSLMKHIRSGAEWDLDRKSSGLTVLPPFSTEDDVDAEVYKNRLDGLKANMSYLRNLEEEYVILTNCNHVMSIDFTDMLDFHIKSGAKVTCLYATNPINSMDKAPSTWIKVGNDGAVEEIEYTNVMPDNMQISLNTYIFRRKDLLDELYTAIRLGKESLRNDILIPLAGSGKLMAYGIDDPVLFVDDVPGYLKCNLALLDADIRDAIFHSKSGPVITKVKDSAPTKYGPDANVSNSLIADGTLIEGTVRNSIVFRGAKIGKGAIVENCVIMQDSSVSAGARLSYAVLDKEVFIEPDRILSGYITRPFMIEKRTRI